MMRIAVVILAFSYVFFGYVDGPSMLIAASGFVGFSLGLAIPVVFAWTVDRSNDENRGKALATSIYRIRICYWLRGIDRSRDI